MNNCTRCALEYKIKKTNSNFLKLKESLHGFVYKMSLNYTKLNPSISKDDLIQAGYVGVLSAIDRFDFNSGNEFLTYAVWYIKMEMGSLKFKSLPVRYSHHLYDCKKNKHQRNKDLLIINKTLEIDSLDYDILSYDPTEEIENKITIDNLFKNLKDQQKEKIVREYYGIGLPKKNLAIIAASKKKCRERMRQIKEDTITKLRRIHDKTVTNTVKNSDKLYS